MNFVWEYFLSETINIILLSKGIVRLFKRACIWIFDINNANGMDKS